MKIFFLGTGCELCDAERDYISTVIEVNGQAYVFDAGCDVFSKMTNLSANVSGIKAVFVSKCSYDRLGGLSKLINIFSWTKTFDGTYVEYYFSDAFGMHAVVDYVKDMKDTPRVKGKFRVYSEGEIYKDENIRVSAVMNCGFSQGGKRAFGFFVEAEGKRIVISGELTDLSKEAVFDALNGGGCELFICELSGMDLDLTVRRAADAECKNIVFTRILPDALINSDHFDNSSRISFVSDGSEVVL